MTGESPDLPRSDSAAPAGSIAGGEAGGPTGGEPALAFVNPALVAATSTAPRTMEDALARIQLLADAVRRADHDLASFVYKVSHDMKAPLRAIRSYSQFLMEDHASALDDEARSFLTRLQVNADAVSEQLLGLLEFSRIGRWCKPWEMVDLEQVVRLVFAQFAERCAARGIELRIHGTFPAVPGERLRLVQLFELLIDNAVKFRKPDAAAGYVTVEAGPAAPHDSAQSAVVTVRDDGIGIDPRQHDRIFVVFERLQPRDYPGIGMGLALARRIVEYHQGKIWVTSAPGAGAEFHVSFGKEPAAAGPSA